MNESIHDKAWIHVQSVHKVTWLLSMGGVLGFLVNLLHPQPIPWVYSPVQITTIKAHQAGVDVISLQEAYAGYKEGRYVFVDARPAEMYASGHIPGALSLPLSQINHSLELLHRIFISPLPVVVYCADSACDDALALIKKFREIRQAPLLYFSEGFAAWEAALCPLE